MSNSDAPTADELTTRIDHLEHQLAKLLSERETALTGWPNEPTVAQGFMAGRWQRRDGDGYTQALVNIPEAPFDNNYYGRYQYTWQPVVEEAPAATSRRSTYGWARASAGSDITWISLDDILANFQPAGNYAPAGNYLDKSGGQMTGPLIARDGGSAANPGIAIGENSTGFYRTSGNLLVTTVSGQIVMQIQAAIAALFVPLNLTDKILSGVADPANATDALNLRTGDTRYIRTGAGGFLPISGGTMTGPLIAQPGTGTQDLAVGIGDATTGFYRVGGSLAMMALGFPLMLLDGNARSVQLTGPLSAGGNPVTNVANAVLPDDAANKRYVDGAIVSARTPSVLYDLPADVLIPGDGEWHFLAQVPFPLARTGVSRIQITLNCNTSGVNNVAAIGARLIDGAVERSVFGFGITPGGDSVGFACNLYLDTPPGLINIPVELTSLALQGSPTAFTVLGGTGPRRSQIVIVDLGPVS